MGGGVIRNIEVRERRHLEFGGCSNESICVMTRLMLLWVGGG